MYCFLLWLILCIVSFRSYVFCLLVVLVKSSLHAKRLARKTPPRKPNRGGGSSPQSPGGRLFMIFLVYCIISLFNCIICSYCRLALCDIPYTFMARYSLFVLKVPLSTKQANKLPNFIQISRHLRELQLKNLFAIHNSGHGSQSLFKSV